MSGPRILWIDACGALLSALSLGLVLPLCSAEVGATAAALRTLAAVALIYLLFDVACLIAGPRHAPFALAVIAVANAVFPVFTAAVFTADGLDLTRLGVAYVGGETLIVWTLAVVEWRTASARDPISSSPEPRRDDRR